MLQNTIQQRQIVHMETLTTLQRVPKRQDKIAKQMFRKGSVCENLLQANKFTSALLIVLH